MGKRRISPRRRGAVVTVLNKVDAIRPVERVTPGGTPDARFVCSPARASTAPCRTRAALPEGSFLYPEDEISTAPVRFFVAGWCANGARAAR
jgi:hypothetical protein